MEGNIWIHFLLTTIVCVIFITHGEAADNVEQEKSNPSLERSLQYVKGHQTFQTLFFNEHEKSFLDLVKKGQSPRTLFISCSDSRVIPELIVASNPGDLFVIRTAGNFVPPFDSKIAWDGVAATIQYAVEVLGVKDIIVCGHSHCGAIHGLFDESKSPGLELLKKWLRFGQDAKKVTLASIGKDASEEERDRVAEHLSVLFQLEHLLTYGFIKSKVDSQEIYLHGWHFSIESGNIEYYDPQSYRFLPLVGGSAEKSGAS